MCIAILNRAGTLDKNTFENCWHTNPDGTGIAYVEDNELKIIKEMDSVDRIYGIYTEIRKVNDLPMIIHFRIATSGYINEDNCHPFEISPGLAMAHNGIITNVTPTAQVSDTRVFITEVLSGLPDYFLYNDAIRQLIGGFIEESKLIFLDCYGMFCIINEHLGHWDEKHTNWYSNYSYMDYRMSYQLDRRSPHRGKGNWKFSAYEDADACEACGNYVEAHRLSFVHYLNANICNDCMEWYKEEVESDIESYR